MRAWGSTISSGRSFLQVKLTFCHTGHKVVFQTGRSGWIDIVPLYFAAERPVVYRDSNIIMVDDDRMRLLPGEKPEVCFALCEGDEVEAVYAYCNLHSLWKA